MSDSSATVHRPALALELSDRHGSVALRDANGVVRTVVLGAGRDAAEEAMVAVDRLAIDANVQPRDLRFVAVSIGPGSFTGVRIAVALGQSICAVTRAVAVGVPSALVAIESTLIDDEATRAISLLAIKSRDGITDAWVTRATLVGNAWSIVDAAELARIDELQVDPAETIVADAALLPGFAINCRWAKPRFDAGACLSVADRLLDAGAACDPLALRALYPRVPEAVAIWQRQHGAP